MLRQVSAFVMLAMFCVVIGVNEPRFFAPRSIESMLLWMPIITVAALGQMLVIVSGGIDVSIGSILGCAGIGIGILLKTQPAVPIPFIFAFGILIGTLLGIINASVITWGKISPLITTIGTMAAFRGLAFLISKGDQIDSSIIPDSLTSLANTGISVSSVTLNWLFVMAMLLVGLFAFGLRRTVAGMNLLAFGSNADAAHLRGISGNAVKFWVYTICGATAGLSGVMYASRFGFVNPGSAGQNLELTAIAAVAIGGTKLTGGAGSVVGVLLGCMLLSCLNVALSVLGIDANWQLLAYGTVILIAIIVDGTVERRRIA